MSEQAIYGNPSHKSQLRSVTCRMPYGITVITQCYLPPDTSEHTPPLPQPDRLVLVCPNKPGHKMATQEEHPIHNSFSFRAFSVKYNKTHK